MSSESTSTIDECPVPGMHDLHENMEKNSSVWMAGLIGAMDVAYYSVPDVIPFKPLRFLAKTAIVAGEAAVMLHSNRDTVAGLKKEFLEEWQGMDANSKKGFAATVGAVGIGVGLLVVPVEKWIYHRAEAKRATGTRAAHTKQALVIGALSGLATWGLDQLDK